MAFCSDHHPSSPDFDPVQAELYLAVSVLVERVDALEEELRAQKRAHFLLGESLARSYGS